jgi:hypothetical protein
MRHSTDLGPPHVTDLPPETVKTVNSSFESQSVQQCWCLEEEVLRRKDRTKFANFVKLTAGADNSGARDEQFPPSWPA